MKKLSILICSLDNRKQFLERLMSLLDKQKNDDVEILVEVDNGEMTIGEKRNFLIKKSNGKYVCFIDDDDMVSNDYVDLILSKIDSNPDVIGFELEYFVNNQLKGIAYHSNKYKTWSDSKSNIPKYGTIYYRCPNHLNPIKRELVLDIMYEKINHGEDRIFSEKISSKLITEEYINKPIYFYYFRTSK